MWQCKRFDVDLVLCLLCIDQVHQISPPFCCQLLFLRRFRLCHPSRAVRRVCSLFTLGSLFDCDSFYQAFGGSLQVLHSPSGLSGHGETRHDHGALRQRLRGGWFAPLMPDVPSHQAPNLEPQDVRSMLRSPSTTSLTENSDKKARPGRWFARVATRLRRRQRYTHTHTHTHTHTQSIA
jgi:hypothetical protein